MSTSPQWVSVTSGAVARVCALNQIPFLVLRAITDSLDGGDAAFQAQRFNQNVPVVLHRLWRLLVHQREGPVPA